MKTSSTDTRVLACLSLNRVIQDKLSLPYVLKDLQLDPGDSKLSIIREMCYGSARYYERLSGLIKLLLQKPLRQKDSDIYQLMIIGAYQLLYMRTPAHAALSETVNACDALGKGWAKNLVNGVLRNLQRNHDDLSAQLIPHQQAALPKWLYQSAKRQWPKHLEQICAAYNANPPMSLRVNTQKTTLSDYEQALKQQDLAPARSDFAADALILAQGVPVSELPNFDQGFCSVQDESAQLAARLVMAAQPKRILDACAAPGGKTCHMAELDPSAHIVAVDNEAHRLERVQQNLTRLQLDAELHCADAGEPEQWWNGEYFDAILLDAPCSATGVIRRNPDIKLLRQPEDIEKLPAIQLNLLESLWPCLKPGGFLLYATCSIMKQENDAVIYQALANLSDASITKLGDNWGIGTNYGRQLLPSATRNDGFYYAGLQKALPA